MRDDGITPPESLPRTSSEHDRRVSDRKARQERANTPLGRLLRYLGLVLGLLIGWAIGAALDQLNAMQHPGPYTVMAAAALGALGFLTTPYIVFWLFDRLSATVRRVTIADFAALIVGLLIGGVLSALLAWPLSLLPSPAGSLAPTVVAVVLTTVAATATVVKRDELLALFQRGTVAAQDAPIIVDTSALIDGRIRDLLRLGFLQGPLLVPQSVIYELQQLADAGDAQRQTKGKRGLDLLRQLQQDPAITVVVDATPPTGESADHILLELARTHQGRLFTCDHALTEVARLAGIPVLNLYALERALRPPVRPGDTLTLKVLGEGREAGQGIGYLDDGTLVVIEAGAQYIGSQVTVTIQRMLQTNSGRLVFAQPVAKEEQG